MFILIGDSIINATEITTAYEVTENGNDCVKVEFKKGAHRIITGTSKEDFFEMLSAATCR